MREFDENVCNICYQKMWVTLNSYFKIQKFLFKDILGKGIVQAKREGQQAFWYSGSLWKSMKWRSKVLLVLETQEMLETNEIPGELFLSFLKY